MFFPLLRERKTTNPLPFRRPARSRFGEGVGEGEGGGDRVLCNSTVKILFGSRNLFFFRDRFLGGFLVFFGILFLGLILRGFDPQSFCRMIPAQVKIEPG